MEICDPWMGRVVVMEQTGLYVLLFIFESVDGAYIPPRSDLKTLGGWSR